MITRAFAIAMLGTVLLAAPAHAHQDEAMSVDVKIADLDLGSASDRARLDRRIRQAAGQICGAEPRGLELRGAHRACMGEVLTDAEIKLAQLIDRTAPLQVARRTR